MFKAVSGACVNINNLPFCHAYIAVFLIIFYFVLVNLVILSTSMQAIRMFLPFPSNKYLTLCLNYFPVGSLSREPTIIQAL